MPNRKHYEVRQGSVVVKIYRAPIRGRENWTVSWVGPNGRERINKNNEAEAKAIAKEQAKKLLNGKTVQLAPSEAAEYREAVSKLASVSMTLPQAVSEIIAAKKIFPGPLSDSATLSAQKHNINSKPIAEVIEELLAARKHGVSLRHYEDIETRLKKLKAFTDAPIGQLLQCDFEKWLDGLKVSGRNRNNFIGALSNLVGFAKARRYLPKEWNELPERRKVVSEPPNPHSPGEFEKLLRAAEAMEDKRFVLYFVLRGFFGIRDGESRRIADSIRAAHLVVEGIEGKVSTRRLIPMHGQAKEWVTRYPPNKGILVPNAGDSFLNRVKKIFDEAGVPRRHNGLRDGFISYRMAQTHNAALVSEESGNSPRKIKESYRAVTLADGMEITEELASQWFGISPKPS